MKHKFLFLILIVGILALMLLTGCTASFAPYTTPPTPAPPPTPIVIVQQVETKEAKKSTSGEILIALAFASCSAAIILGSTALYLFMRMKQKQNNQPESTLTNGTVLVNRVTIYVDGYVYSSDSSDAIVNTLILRGYSPDYARMLVDGTNFRRLS